MASAIDAGSYGVAAVILVLMAWGAQSLVRQRCAWCRKLIQRGAFVCPYCDRLTGR